MKFPSRVVTLAAACTALASALPVAQARGPADVIADPAEIGMQLPGVMARSIKEERLLEAQDGKGNVVTVARTTRAPGTRTPLHLHEYGGSTCVLEGEMTLFLEGAEPRRAVAGQCYYMPAGKAMAGVNTGTVNAVMLDTFLVPLGMPVWTVVETAGRELQNQFDAAEVPHKH